MRVKTEPPTQIPPDLIRTIEEVCKEMGIEEVTVSTFLADDIPGMNETYDFMGPVVIVNPKESKVRFEESLFSRDELYKRGKIAKFMAILAQRKLGYESIIKDAEKWSHELTTDQNNLFMFNEFLYTVKGYSADQIVIDHGYVKELYHMRQELLKRRESLLFPSKKLEPYSTVEEYLATLIKYYFWVPFSLCSRTEEANELNESARSQVNERIPRISNVYDTVGNIFLN